MIRGSNCQFSHNYIEFLYHPSKYKTKFCSLYPNSISKCTYGNFCSFAHHESELQISLLHNLEFDEDFYIFLYKTVWCPFNLSQHDKSLCVYAHNWYSISSTCSSSLLPPPFPFSLLPNSSFLSSSIYSLAHSNLYIGKTFVANLMKRTMNIFIALIGTPINL